MCWHCSINTYGKLTLLVSAKTLIFDWLRINVMHEIDLQWLPKSCFNSSRELNRWWGLNSVPHNENIKNDFFMLFMAPAGLLLSTVFWSLKFGCKFDFFWTLLFEIHTFSRTGLRFGQYGLLVSEIRSFTVLTWRKCFGHFISKPHILVRAIFFLSLQPCM